MRTRVGLFATGLIIFCLGVVIVYNTTSAEVIDKAVDAYRSVGKQIAFGMFGACMGFVIYRIGYEWFVDKSLLLFLGAIGLLLLVLVAGMQINGARRWINCFGISLQPSEFVKLIVPMYYIRSSDKQTSFWAFCWRQAIMMIPIFLIIIEPDNGTAAILLATMVALYFITQVRWVYWVIPIAIVLSGGVTLALSMKHVSDRIYIYLHPEADLLGKGHQPYQAKIATGSGGLLGKGLGESMQKYNYLPEARSDYIAAIYAEEFGFIGMVVLILLYMILATLGFHTAIYAQDSRGYYLALIYTFMISLQAFLNLGVVSGLLPSKGTNLPFFSQGGSSLLANTFMLALMMSVRKREQSRV